MSLITRGGLLVPRPLPGRTTRANTSTTRGLLGWWTMDSQDTSGTSIRDRSGLGNAGTFVGSPGLTGGKIGQALSLNGSSQYVSVPGSFGGNNVTVALWVKFNAIGAGANSMLIERDDDTTNWGVSLQLNSSNPNFGLVLGGSASVLIGNTALSTGLWYQLVGTYDGANQRLYINGLQDTASPLAASGTIRGTGSRYTIGGLGLSGGRYTNGVVDDVRVYNRAISGAEVLQLYNNPAADYVYGNDLLRSMALVAAAPTAAAQLPLMGVG